MRIIISLCAILLSVSPVLGRARVPRASPSPCTQAYVCPEPRPYPGYPDTGNEPGPGRFKCRIGSSSSDPNFAFCIYEKVLFDATCPDAVLTNWVLLTGYGHTGRSNAFWRSESVLECWDAQPGLCE